MYNERKEDLSVYYWLKNLFSTAPSIAIEDGFPETLLNVPCIAVDWRRLTATHFEIGNKIRLGERIFYIDVFGINKTQRDEMAYKILHQLEEPIPVYDYDEGYPPEVSPTQIGSLVIDDEVRIEIVRIYPEMVGKLYYRATVTFVAKFEQI